MYIKLLATAWGIFNPTLYGTCISAAVFQNKLSTWNIYCHEGCLPVTWGVTKPTTYTQMHLLSPFSIYMLYNNTVKRKHADFCGFSVFCWKLFFVQLIIEKCIWFLNYGPGWRVLWSTWLSVFQCVVFVIIFYRYSCMCRDDDLFSLCLNSAAGYLFLYISSF